MMRARVWHWRAPLWLAAVVVLPLALLFMASLAVAGAVVVGAALLASLVLPRLGARPARRPASDDRTIELDRSEYRRLPRQ
ncbi:MAG: hypothetical protein SF182_05215 [Deltaproteobacteria bacterium]|nr:hypothetical protein [Deltaproteobacteria bacterium]